jgi:hypothetical protein
VAVVADVHDYYLSIRHHWILDLAVASAVFASKSCGRNKHG